MVFTDWWWIPTIILVVGLLLSLALGFFPAPDEPIIVRLGVSGVLFVAGLIVLNLVVFMASSTSTQDRTATVAETTEQFGFVPGDSYPLLIGDRIEGSTGQGYVRRGLFFVEAGFSVQPGSAVSIGFQHEANSYILELPMSGLTFVQDANASPSIQLFLTEKTSRELNSTIPGDGTRVEYTYGGCGLLVQDFLATCGRETTNVDYIFSEETLRAGLAPVVAERFESATITLTPDMYVELLG